QLRPGGTGAGDPGHAADPLEARGPEPGQGGLRATRDAARADRDFGVNPIVGRRRGDSLASISMERVAGAAADRIRYSPLFRIMPIMSLTTCAIALIGLGRHSHRETRWLQTVRHPRYSPWRTRDRNIVSWIGQEPSGEPDSPRDAAMR